MRAEDMTPVQRHNMTCPVCETLTADGIAFAAHLEFEHGLSRDERMAIYQNQVATAPELSLPVGDRSK